MRFKPPVLSHFHLCVVCRKASLCFFQLNLWVDTLQNKRKGVDNLTLTPNFSDSHCLCSLLDSFAISAFSPGQWAQFRILCAGFPQQIAFVQCSRFSLPSLLELKGNGFLVILFVLKITHEPRMITGKESGFSLHGSSPLQIHLKSTTYHHVRTTSAACSAEKQSRDNRGPCFDRQAPFFLLVLASHRFPLLIVPCSKAKCLSLVSPVYLGSSVASSRSPAPKEGGPSLILAAREWHFSYGWTDIRGKESPGHDQGPSDNAASCNELITDASSPNMYWKLDILFTCQREIDAAAPRWWKSVWLTEGKTTYYRPFFIENLHKFG